MSLRSEAVAAYQASQNDRASEARAALSDVLAPSDVTGLTVEGISVTDTSTVVVFTDGDIHLGVRTRGEGWDVHIVEPAGSGVDAWRENGPAIESLAQLGKVLPDLDPVNENQAPTTPTYAEWVQPTGSTDAYALGDRVTHNGKAWESLVDSNVWEPGVSQWREVI